MMRKAIGAGNVWVGVVLWSLEDLKKRFARKPHWKIAVNVAELAYYWSVNYDWALPCEMIGLWLN